MISHKVVRFQSMNGRRRRTWSKGIETGFTHMATFNPIEKVALNIGADILINAGPKLAQIEPVRRWVVGKIEHKMLSGLKQSRTDHERTSKAKGN